MTAHAHRHAVAADLRALMATGRRLADATLERVGIRRCTSCDAMPWECPCPMSIRQRNGWEHDDLNAIGGFGVHRSGEGPTAGRMPALPSIGRRGDAAAELRQLILTLEQLHANALRDVRPGLAVAIAQARAAAERAGIA